LTESTDPLTIAEVDPRSLHDLRRRVLRGGDPSAQVSDVRDDEATSLHLAGLVDGAVVVCASFYPAADPYAPQVRAFQLRFMATDPAHQGRGYGARVLAEAERRLEARGAERLWANARDTALGFYQRTGWTAVPGSEFVSEWTALPHTVIFRPLGDRTLADAPRRPH
jgi:GNAT superfamily N-acetyltransferase